MVFGYVYYQYTIVEPSFYLVGYNYAPDFLFYLYACFTVFILNNLRRKTFLRINNHHIFYHLDTRCHLHLSIDLCANGKFMRNPGSMAPDIYIYMDVLYKILKMFLFNLLPNDAFNIELYEAINLVSLINN